MGGPSASANPLVGRVVSHYRIVEQIGSGGMGAVYIADDEALGRRVAFKAIRHDHGDSLELRQRFQREARLLSRLDHPNICRIHDYIEGDDQDFLVLELIGGGTLKEHIAPELPQAEALRLADGIAQALVAAHAEGIVHRDLKPANVMVTEAGVVKVLDFGLARPATSTDAAAGTEAAPAERERPASEESSVASQWSSVEVTLTEAGSVTGTLAYMSPEQARAEPLTTASDVFSLGLILQELLTGERAYPKGMLPVELWELCKGGRARPFDSRDGQLRTLVESMKSPVASERPTALDVVRALARLRSRPRRRLFQGLAAAGLLLAAGGVAKYVVDMDRSRDEATRRRAQAEDLLVFMVQDLRPKLAGVGSLHLLDEVGEQAQAYFDRVPVSSLSDEELLTRSRVLAELGHVRSEAGDLEGACALFDESLRLVESAGAESLSNESLDWLFELGQSQFYVGYGHYVKGEHREAERWLTRYLETAQRGLEQSGGARRWRVEVAYAHSSLGSQAVAERCPPERAIALFESAAATWRRLLEEEGDDPDLRLELADMLSWLGRLRKTQARGTEDYGPALAAFEEELALRRALLDEQPDNQTHLSRITAARSWMAQLERDLCLHERFSKRLEQVEQSARFLFEWDPENAAARVELAKVLHSLGAFYSQELGAYEAARDFLDEARMHLSFLRQLSPEHEDWRLVAEKVDAQLETNAGYLGQAAGQAEVQAGG